MLGLRCLLAIQGARPAGCMSLKLNKEHKWGYLDLEVSLWFVIAVETNETTLDSIHMKQLENS